MKDENWSPWLVHGLCWTTLLQPGLVLAVNRINGSADQCNDCRVEIRDDLYFSSVWGDVGGDRRFGGMGFIGPRNGTGPRLMSQVSLGDSSSNHLAPGESRLFFRPGETLPDVIYASGSAVCRLAATTTTLPSPEPVCSDTIRVPQLVGLYDLNGDNIQELVVHNAGPNGGILVLDAESLVLLWQSGQLGEGTLQSDASTVQVADLNGNGIPELIWRPYMAYPSPRLEVVSFESIASASEEVWSKPTIWGRVQAGASNYLYPQIGDVWAGDDKAGPEIVVFDYIRAGVVQPLTGAEIPLWEDEQCDELPCLWTQFDYGDAALFQLASDRNGWVYRDFVLTDTDGDPDHDQELLIATASGSGDAFVAVMNLSEVNEDVPTLTPGAAVDWALFIDRASYHPDWNTSFASAWAPASIQGFHRTNPDTGQTGASVVAVGVQNDTDLESIDYDPTSSIPSPRDLDCVILPEKNATLLLDGKTGTPLWVGGEYSPLTAAQGIKRGFETSPHDEVILLEPSLDILGAELTCPEQTSQTCNSEEIVEQAWDEHTATGCTLTKKWRLPEQSLLQLSSHPDVSGGSVQTPVRLDLNRDGTDELFSLEGQRLSAWDLTRLSVVSGEALPSPTRLAQLDLGSTCSAPRVSHAVTQQGTPWLLFECGAELHPVKWDKASASLTNAPGWNKSLTIRSVTNWHLYSGRVANDKGECGLEVVIAGNQPYKMLPNTQSASSGLATLQFSSDDGLSLPVNGGIGTVISVGDGHCGPLVTTDEHAFYEWRVEWNEQDGCHLALRKRLPYSELLPDGHILDGGYGEAFPRASLVPDLEGNGWELLAQSRQNDKSQAPASSLTRFHIPASATDQWDMLGVSQSGPLQDTSSNFAAMTRSGRRDNTEQPTFWLLTGYEYLAAYQATPEGLTPLASVEREDLDWEMSCMVLDLDGNGGQVLCENGERGLFFPALLDGDTTSTSVDFGVPTAGRNVYTWAQVTTLNLLRQDPSQHEYCAAGMEGQLSCWTLAKGTDGTWPFAPVPNTPFIVCNGNIGPDVASACGPGIKPRPINALYSGDIDGDGFDDLITAEESGHVTAISLHGSIDQPESIVPTRLWSMAFPKPVLNLLLTELDGDGGAEVLALTDDGNLSLIGAGSVQLTVGVNAPMSRCGGSTVSLTGTVIGLEPGAGSLKLEVDRKPWEGAIQLSANGIWKAQVSGLMTGQHAFRVSVLDGDGKLVTSVQKRVSVDTGLVQDLDGDGQSACSGDCDDSNASIYSGAVEIPDNKIDEDCDTLVDESSAPTSVVLAAPDVQYVDKDGDGFSPQTGDCDDSDAGKYPGNTEVIWNEKDDDCDMSTADDIGYDLDQDGYCNNGQISSSVGVCSGIAAEDQRDCDDHNAQIKPGAVELLNGLDDDCNGIIEERVKASQDEDGDGYSPDGSVGGASDCNDQNMLQNPKVAEQELNGLDDNCNGLVDERSSFPEATPGPVETPTPEPATPTVTPTPVPDGPSGGCARMGGLMGAGSRLGGLPFFFGVGILSLLRRRNARDGRQVPLK